MPVTPDIPSPSDLTYFIEVARLLNLSRASESLGISQPSLTMAIRRIEKAIGTEIFIRHKQGVTLTVAGKQLLTYARQLLQQWDAIKAEALASQHEIQGCFTIGCHPSIALYALPRFLPKLVCDYPKLEIKLEHDLSRRITEQVINFKIDIGITVNPTKHADLIIKQLSTDKVTLWRANNKNQPVNETVLICDPELTQTQNIFQQMKKREIHFERMLPSNNLEVIASLTENGCGIGILPGNVVANRRLMSVPDAPFYSDEICLLYRGENRDVKAIQVITENIKACFKS